MITNGYVKKMGSFNNQVAANPMNGALDPLIDITQQMTTNPYVSMVILNFD